MKLVHLKWLQMLKCLMMLLTATLPSMLENKLNESMLIQYTQYIQMITVQLNICYMMQQCELGKLSEIMKKICWQQKKKLVTKVAVTVAETDVNDKVR